MPRFVIRYFVAACALSALTLLVDRDARPSPILSAPTIVPTPVAAPSLAPLHPAGGVLVPSSIDSTGRTDVASALMSFLDTVPDGATVLFRSSGIYRLDQALKFFDRHGLVFEGNGATLKSNGGTTEASSLFWLGADGGGNSSITIRDFKLVGNSSAPGVYQPAREGAHGILVDAGRDIEVTNVTVTSIWGDCFYVGSWADDVWIHDSICESGGRNGVTVTAGSNVTVDHVSFPTSGYVTFDVEPNEQTGGATDIVFRDNTIGTFGQDFVAVEGSHTGATINGIDIKGNRVIGGTLRTVIDNGGTSRMRNVVFINNSSEIAGHGPVLVFAHIDGLIVSRNQQPLISGVIASIADSSSVTSQ